MALESNQSRGVAADMIAQTKEQQRAQKRAEAADAAVDRLFRSRTAPAKAEPKAAKTEPKQQKAKPKANRKPAKAAPAVELTGKKGRPTRVSKDREVKQICIKIPADLLDAMDREIAERKRAGEQGLSRTGLLCEVLDPRYEL